MLLLHNQRDVRHYCESVEAVCSEYLWSSLSTNTVPGGESVARTVTLNGQAVKIRHPLAPLGLGIITFGIYTLVWYYLINDEMRRQGEDVSPGISLLAVTLGALLIIPPFVSMYNTAERIRRSQEGRGVSKPISPLLALLLLFIPIANIFQTAYLQSGLNRAWERRAGDFSGPAAGPAIGAATAPTTPETPEVPPGSPAP
jgi:hypothetical protein